MVGSSSSLHNYDYCMQSVFFHNKKLMCKLELDELVRVSNCLIKVIKHSRKSCVPVLLCMMNKEGTIVLLSVCELVNGEGLHGIGHHV